MPDNVDKLLKIPVTATYQMINGEPVLVSAEYADISADAIARFLLRAFRVYVDEQESRGEE